MVVQALKQVKDQAKAAMSTHFSSPAAPGSSPSARPGLATRPTASPQLTPRTEREQPALPPLEPSSTGTAASPVPQAGPPPPGRKSQSRAPTVDDRSSGGHGPLPQVQAQPQAQYQAQPSTQSPPHLPPAPPQLSPALPAQVRAQHTQPPASGPDPRKSTESPAPRVSRPPNGRSTGHENNNHRRDGEARQYEAIDESLRKWEKQLGKREATVMSLLADIKEREDNLASLEDKVRYYESDPYRQEVLSIRKHMQVNDMQEVSTITEKFRRITRKVEDISRDLGEKLSDSQAIRELKTVDLVTILRQRSSGKKLGEVGVITLPIDPEDFIDFGCRALLNDWLVERICGPNIFHPALVGRSENDLFLNMHRTVRKQESQTIAGRWRVSTFNAINLHGCYPQATAQAIAQEFCQNALTPLCDHVYKPEAYAEPIGTAFGAITELFQSALDWTHLSKTSVVMLDFQPGFAPPGSPFDPEGAQLEGPGKKIPGPEGILLTSKLGLYSSRARGAQGAEHTTQIPAKVLTAQYFS